MGFMPGRRMICSSEGICRISCRSVDQAGDAGLGHVLPRRQGPGKPAWPVLHFVLESTVVVHARFGDEIERLPRTNQPPADVDWGGHDGERRSARRHGRPAERQSLRSRRIGRSDRRARADRARGAGAAGRSRRRAARSVVLRALGSREESRARTRRTATSTSTSVVAVGCLVAVDVRTSNRAPSLQPELVVHRVTDSSRPLPHRPNASRVKKRARLADGVAMLELELKVEGNGPTSRNTFPLSSTRSQPPCTSPQPVVRRTSTAAEIAPGR